MKAVLQRVISASVTVNGETVGSCGKGYMILFCAVEGDTEEEQERLAQKTVHLRVFEDEDGKMNRSILDINGEILVISQFTLCANTKKGNRPSFIGAMNPDAAKKMYDRYCEKLEAYGVRRVEKGVFGAEMQVSLVNDGPVTILLDTEVWKKS
ncbi:MAG: D-tyrosyl-tRNA(Tyr) deacylase [Clostridia bacterium]|nr:D-tyrosyl-tRNA(Tyr) deacylase [Clostridia bacterium]